MNLKTSAARALVAGALGFTTLGLGAVPANADPWPPPLPGISVPDLGPPPGQPAKQPFFPPPGQLGQLPFFPPPGQLGQLPFVPPPGLWDKPWKWVR
ncbi:hypothetical protein [Rhodococcus koreensis]|uniref:Uncharacterized protein n=1 Tax=Rhodococcus koreensis TaxID=99653 RepID=A0A1H4ZXD7_9NOCA|nr:hypothetical protein [Rhodococcus koreensis]QSE79138.1 hypothetical protein JWS14_08275 [Rhodococcus koreensis]SED33980.1 hypothetical protein SAMN04490239_7873 [Rhodococcus koreensis]